MHCEVLATISIPFPRTEMPWTADLMASSSLQLRAILKHRQLDNTSESFACLRTVRFCYVLNEGQFLLICLCPNCSPDMFCNRWMPSRASFRFATSGKCNEARSESWTQPFPIKRSKQVIPRTSSICSKSRAMLGSQLGSMRQLGQPIP